MPSENRVTFSCFVTPAVRAIIKTESLRLGLSQGELVDEAVLAWCNSPEGLAIIQEHARKDPLNIALARKANLPPNQPAPPPRPKPKKRSGK